jgi:hypothetical protein
MTGGYQFADKLPKIVGDLTPRPMCPSYVDRDERVWSALIRKLNLKVE